MAYREVYGLQNEHCTIIPAGTYKIMVTCILLQNEHCTIIRAGTYKIMVTCILLQNEHCTIIPG